MTTSNEINSIARAAEVLKLLSNGVEKMTEISKRLDVNKATVHRIMKTLESKGLVSQDATSRKYYLGPLIQTLAENPLTVHRILVHVALDGMELLRDRFGETVVLQIRRGGQRLVLEKVLGNQSIRYFPETVETSPVHAGAGAKILLAEMDRAELSAFLDRFELVKVGPNTIDNKEKLMTDLETIRSKGYAISFGETVEGAAGIAVPIKNYSCPVALVIVGPEERMRENRSTILQELKISAESISNKIATVTGIKSALE